MSNEGAIEGGCYCGNIRYRAEGEPLGAGQCHCRECQYISGGNANVSMIFPGDGFRFTQGEPKTFTRSDVENPVTRYFCPDCGTHLCTRSPTVPGAWIVKAGTLDDPSLFKPGMAIWTSEKQWYHHIPEGIPTFPGFPAGS